MNMGQTLVNTEYWLKQRNISKYIGKTHTYMQHYHHRGQRNKTFTIFNRTMTTKNQNEFKQERYKQEKTHTNVVMSKPRYGVVKISTEVRKLFGSGSRDAIQITTLEQFLHPLVKKICIMCSVL